MTAVDDFLTNPSVEAFAPGALVHDNGREFRGTTAIGRWIAEEITGPRVTTTVRDREVVHGVEAVTAAADGDFDKTGLPDPLVLTYYFTPAGDRIGTLFITQTEARHDA